MKQIQLNQEKYVIVDDEDFEYLNQWKWTYSRWGYAQRLDYSTGKNKVVLMHRLILNTPKGKDTDHINGDRLDNRKINLRISTQQQNLRNMMKRTNRKYTSQYKGVHYFPYGKRIKRWKAAIKVKYKDISLGYFLTEQAAALAYDEAARKIFGEFAKPNFPQGGSA